MIDEKKECVEMEKPLKQVPSGYGAMYANNVQFEPCFWDLKLLFGQLAKHENDPYIEQHTEITIPWTYAKVLLYNLYVHIALHEAAYGKIEVSKQAILLAPIAEEAQLNMAFAEKITNLHNQLFGSDTKS